MKIIINKTNIRSAIKFNGNEYVVSPDSTSLPVSDEVAERWIQTHSFLEVQDVVDKKIVDKIKEEVKEEVPVEAKAIEEVEQVEEVEVKDDTFVKTVEKKIKKIIK